MTTKEAREKRLADAPAQMRKYYREAWKGKSRKTAIKAFCLECTGYSYVDIRECTATACPLYEFRLNG